MAEPIIVDEHSFDTAVLRSTVPVLVDFWAPWCNPCRQIAPLLDEIAAEHAGKIVVAKLNVDENPNLTAQYRITSIPALKVFVAGREVREIIGNMQKAALEEQLREIM